jgi:hypothetical protein
MSKKYSLGDKEAIRSVIQIHKNCSLLIIAHVLTEQMYVYVHMRIGRPRGDSRQCPVHHRIVAITRDIFSCLVSVSLQAFRSGLPY